jgi:hypothetical protein
MMSLSIKKQSLREERYSQTTYKSMEVFMLRNLCTAALLAVMLVVLVAGNVQSQTVNANLNGSATVLTALSIVQSTALAFGNIPASRTAILDPKGLSNSYVGSVHSAGLLTIAGANNTPIIITFPSTMNLTNGTPAQDLTLTLAVTGDKLLANQSTSGSLTSPAIVTTANVGDATPGAYFVWVGGSLPSGVNAAAFTGTANFVVEYQ